MVVTHNLNTIVEIIDCVKNGIAIWDVFNRPIRKNELDALFEFGPFIEAVKIVGHEKSAAQKVLTHDLRLSLVQSPLADLHGVEPRPIEGFVAVLKLHGLFHGA